MFRYWEWFVEQHGARDRVFFVNIGLCILVTRFGLCFGLANTFDFEGKSSLFLLFVTFPCYILQTVKNSLSNKKNESPDDTQAQGNAALAVTEEFSASDILRRSKLSAVRSSSGCL